MSQVEFNDESKSASLLYAKFQSSAELPKMVQWSINKGIVKTHEQANMLLIVVAIVSIIIAIVILYSMNKKVIVTNDGYNADEHLRSVQQTMQYQSF